MDIANHSGLLLITIVKFFIKNTSIYKRKMFIGASL